MLSLPFDPLINAWFTETYGKPTPVQEAAWPLIAGGEHVLAIAPTGSGKTLTGFLSAISRFAEGSYEADKLCVLYVSPLKALNEDIRRNLIFPLEGIAAQFEKEGEYFPAIRVETRSGDTPQYERQRFLKRPPSILALTPESLGIILLNRRGRDVLSTVRYVIIDEIHATLGSKRGCYLSCQIDRLTLVAGEFQRVALSATIKPPEAAAEFAGGLVKTAEIYKKRKVHIVSPAAEKKLELKVLFPGGIDNKTEKSLASGASPGAANEAADQITPEAAAAAALEAGLTGAERFGKRYAELIRFIIERIRAGCTKGRKAAGKEGENNDYAWGNTILVFTDSRRRAERISYLLNQAGEEEPDFSGRPLSYCHHGSLSKDVRREVEKALASGEIPCVVATGSLELGIDIGGVEEVILAGSPGSTAVALQRIGRSGHGVGMVSKGWLIPFHGMDLVQAAAVSGAVEDRELEETESIENPLDILAQIILSFVTERDWNEDELFMTIRGMYVYQSLSRFSYDSVLRMLTGAYEDTRLRELKRHIFRDDETGTLSASPGALLLLYTSGGVIASRGYYSMRLSPMTEGGYTKIGELDEEFVWERRLGDCFDFGNRSWRITAITDEAVEVIPLPAGADSVPFWHGEAVYRSPVLSRRMLDLLDGYNETAKEKRKPKDLMDRFSAGSQRALKNFSAEALEALDNFLSDQLSAQAEFQEKVLLPGPSFIPVEIIDDPAGRSDAYIVILHSFRGGGINVPLSLALARELEIRLKERIDGSADDNAIFIRLPRSVSPDARSVLEDALRGLARGGKGEERFRERLEASGVFGAAFREAAERSLLLPRSPAGKRIPLWVLRQRSKRLFDAVASYRDFPTAAEAWRTCLKESFDMAAFISLLDEIGTGVIGLEFFRTKNFSPFSREQEWIETNSLMYQYDGRPELMSSMLPDGAGPSLSDQVIAEALGNSSLRPPLKARLIQDFCSRLRRELPGWAPEDSLTLCEWVKERIAIPAADEWERLLKCINDELSEELKQDRSLGGKLVYITLDGAQFECVVHREWIKRWKAAASSRVADCLAQWLRYQGPLPLSRIAGVFALSPDETEEAVRILAEQGDLTPDVVVESDSPADSSVSYGVYIGKDLVCDRENLELLLRLSRRKQRPEIKERPARVLIPFIARRQGLHMTGSDASGNKASFCGTHLTGISAPAKLWETEFFPSRCPSYEGEMLDKEIREGRILWYGTGKEKAAFCGSGDLDLLLPVSHEPFSSSGMAKNFFDTPRSFWEIKEALEQSNNSGPLSSVTETLWDEVWKGSLSADSWDPLRRAIELGFTSAESSFNARLAESGANAGAGNSVIGRRSLRVPRAVRERWKSGPPVRGNWFSLAPDLDNPGSVNQGSGGPGILQEEELNRERVRLLLDRWGILTRPLLERETAPLSWSRLLPAIRRMELAGELVTGRFFGGVASLQFASPGIAEELEKAEAERGIYWMNAADPASPAGLAVQGIFAPNEPQVRRLSSSRLCFRGAELLAVSNRNGKELFIYISPDDPDIAEALAFIKHPRTRRIQNDIKISVEKINGSGAAKSEYSSVLTGLGFVKDRLNLVLW